MLEKYRYEDALIQAYVRAKKVFELGESPLDYAAIIHDFGRTEQLLELGIFNKAAVGYALAHALSGGISFKEEVHRRFNQEKTITALANFLNELD